MLHVKHGIYWHLNTTLKQLRTALYFLFLCVHTDLDLHEYLLGERYRPRALRRWSYTRLSPPNAWHSWWLTQTSARSYGSWRSRPILIPRLARAVQILHIANLFSTMMADKASRILEWADRRENLWRMCLVCVLKISLAMLLYWNYRVKLFSDIYTWFWFYFGNSSNFLYSVHLKNTIKIFFNKGRCIKRGPTF